MIGIPNDLGLPRPEAPWSGKPLPSNKHPLNVKARELMEQVGAYFRSDQLHVVSLAYWGLEQVLGFGEAELESNDLAHAVRELKIWTEAKEAMKFLLKERNLPDQMYTARELQEMFLEMDDPELGAVITLQLIARGAVKETADLVVSEHLQEHDPQEILMLLQNSRQSQEQHLTPLVGSTTRASINSPDVSSELNFKSKQEKVIRHSENQVKTSEPQVKEKVVHYSEDQIKDIVADYFKSLRIALPGYSVKREYLIQMGSSLRKADIVFLRNGKLVAIAECKRTRRVEKGNEQLHSYLCATDTFLGIFANHSDPNKWIFWENHRHNNFLEIDRETFENYVYNHDKAIKPILRTSDFRFRYLFLKPAWSLH